MKRHRIRQVVAIGLLVLLSAGAGCTGTGMFGLGGQDQSADPSKIQYDWNTSADVTLNLSADQYRSVYSLNQSQLKVYTHGTLGIKEPLDMRALKYRYPNGTVITLDEDTSDSFFVEEAAKQTVIHVPKSGGKVAFITGKSTRSITVPVFIETGKNGTSYEVIIPPDTGVSVPLLSSVRPGGYETKTINNRVHITWDSVESSSVSVRYYLQRDLLIFGSIAAVLTVAGLLGAGYYAVQIRRLTQLRKKVGLDMETNDDGP